MREERRDSRGAIGVADRHRMAESDDRARLDIAAHLYASCGKLGHQIRDGQDMLPDSDDSSGTPASADEGIKSDQLWDGYGTGAGAARKPFLAHGGRPFSMGGCGRLRDRER